MNAQSFLVISAGPIGLSPMTDSSDSSRPPNLTAYPPKFFLPAIRHLRRGFAPVSAALLSHPTRAQTKLSVRREAVSGNRATSERGGPDMAPQSLPALGPPGRSRDGPRYPDSLLVRDEPS